MLKMNLLEKRVLFKYLMSCQWRGLQTESLPGRKITSNQDLAAAIALTRAVGQRIPFVDLFAVSEDSNMSTEEGVCHLVNLQHI